MGASRDSYMRQGSYAVESMEQCHSKQRSNKSAASPHFSYETKSKSAMKSRWRNERAERQSERKTPGTVAAGALEAIPASPLPLQQKSWESSTHPTSIKKAGSWGSCASGRDKQQLQEQQQQEQQQPQSFFASVGSFFAGGAK